MTVFDNPLPLNAFARVIRQQSVKFWLVDNVQRSGMPKNVQLAAEVGDPFWAAEITMINWEMADAKKIQGLVESMGGGLRDFYLFDTRCEFPTADPTGTILGATTVSITAISDANQVKFTGKPGYVYTPGDMFHFDYGAGNAFRALHRIVGLDPIVANGSGVTDFFQISPYLLDPTITTPKTVTIIRPSCRMKLDADSFDPGTARQVMTSGMSFKCSQVP